MKRLIGLALGFLSIAACASAQIVDAPVALEPGYATREAAQMVDGDRCGPEFVQTKLPGYIEAVLGPVADGPFRPVCERHDACYRLNEQTQAWCDDRMRDEMYAICETGQAGGLYNAPVVGQAFCKRHANLYYAAINTTFGGYAYGGEAGGHMQAPRVHVIRDFFSDDEVAICVDVVNDTRLMQEYDLELHHADGRRIDREPDTHERNVRAGEAREFCVGTNWSPKWSISDLSDTLRLSLRADAPDSFATSNDMVIVDVREVALPAR